MTRHDDAPASANGRASECTRRPLSEVGDQRLAYVKAIRQLEGILEKVSNIAIPPFH